MPVTQLELAEVVAGLIQWAVQESPLPTIITSEIDGLLTASTGNELVAMSSEG